MYKTNFDEKPVTIISEPLGLCESYPPRCFVPPLPPKKLLSLVHGIMKNLDDFNFGELSIIFYASIEKEQLDEFDVINGALKDYLGKNGSKIIHYPDFIKQDFDFLWPALRSDFNVVKNIEVPFKTYYEMFSFVKETEHYGMLSYFFDLDFSDRSEEFKSLPWKSQWKNAFGELCVVSKQQRFIKNMKRMSFTIHFLFV